MGLGNPPNGQNESEIWVTKIGILCIGWSKR